MIFFVVAVAFVQIEGIVKQLATAGEHEKISAVISLLTNDFTYSPQANHRKVCLDRRSSCLCSYEVRFVEFCGTLMLAGWVDWPCSSYCWTHQ